MKRLIFLNIILYILILLTGCNNQKDEINIFWNELNKLPKYLNQQCLTKINEITQKQNEQIVKPEEKIQSADVNPKPGVKKENVKPLTNSTENALKKDLPTVEGEQKYEKPEGSPKDDDIKYENGKKYEYNEVTQNWAEKFDENSGEIKQGETAEEVEKAVSAPDSEKHGY